MCGIAGQVFFDTRSVDIADLHHMSKYLVERGPDHEGYWHNHQVGLVHRRLKIIDLSDAANQPMAIAHGKVIVTYNGEIYNFPQLKKELQSLGHSFITSSDTEVLGYGYLQWGIESLLKRLEGMFAFCLLDVSLQQLYLVRDIFGQKPLYYYHHHDEILFSSDIRSIWSLKHLELSINFDALDYYFTELTVPQPRTIWSEVRQIKPAHFLRVDLNSGECNQVCYWEISKVDKELELNLEDALIHTEQLLTQSIVKRTISDVPYGTFLSSGTDSGLVTALLAQQLSHPLRTFTMGFDYQQQNELPGARLVADKFGTDHTEVVISAEVIKTVRKLIQYTGEPFADSSLIPAYYVCREIGSSLKVALSGDGGDEMFAGYKDYQIAQETDDFINQYPDKWTQYARSLGDKAVSLVKPKHRNLGAYYEYHYWPGHQKLFRHMGINFQQKSECYNQLFPLQSRSFARHYLDDLWVQYQSPNDLSTLMKASLRTRLLNDYLVKIDRASMINSLEVRSPFLDRSLAEFAFSLPGSFHYHQGYSKYLLKQLAVKHLGAHHIDQEKKGFSIPLKGWLRHELKDWTEELIGSLLKRKYLNEGFCWKIWKEHIQDERDNQHLIWALICLEIWFQEFCDR